MGEEGAACLVGGQIHDAMGFEALVEGEGELPGGRRGHPVPHRHHRRDPGRHQGGSEALEDGAAARRAVAARQEDQAQGIAQGFHHPGELPLREQGRPVALVGQEEARLAGAPLRSAMGDQVEHVIALLQLPEQRRPGDRRLEEGGREALVVDAGGEACQGPLLGCQIQGRQEIVGQVVRAGDGHQSPERTFGDQPALPGAAREIPGEGGVLVGGQAQRGSARRRRQQLPGQRPELGRVDAQPHPPQGAHAPGFGPGFAQAGVGEEQVEQPLARLTLPGLGREELEDLRRQPTPGKLPFAVQDQLDRIGISLPVEDMDLDIEIAGCRRSASEVEFGCRGILRTYPPGEGEVAVLSLGVSGPWERGSGGEGRLLRRDPRNAEDPTSAAPGPRPTAAAPPLRPASGRCRRRCRHAPRSFLLRLPPGAAPGGQLGYGHDALLLPGMGETRPTELVCA